MKSTNMTTDDPTANLRAIVRALDAAVRFLDRAQSIRDHMAPGRFADWTEDDGAEESLAGADLIDTTEGARDTLERYQEIVRNHT